MLARFLFKVSVQKKTARCLGPGGFGICLNFVFLRTILYRRLPKPGKEAEKSIKRVCEIRVHLFNVINSWLPCKRASRNFSKQWAAVACIPLKHQQI
jgi:hypothetical protein